MKKFLYALVSIALLAPMFASAQSLLNGNPTSFPQGTVTNTSPTGPVSQTNTSGPFTIHNPLGNISSICGLIKALLSAAIQIGIPIAVLFIIYAGFKFVLAQGSESKLEAAKHNLLYTLIGIGVFLGAWLLTQVVANTITAIGGNGPSSLNSCQ